jgi:hypothetical protein
MDEQGLLMSYRSPRRHRGGARQLGKRQDVAASQDTMAANSK